MLELSANPLPVFYLVTTSEWIYRLSLIRALFLGAIHLTPRLSAPVLFDVCPILGCFFPNQVLFRVVK